MKTIQSILYAAIALLLWGCDSFVEVDLPQSMLTGPQVFQDKSTVEAAMSDIYTKLRDEGFLSGGLSGASASFGLYADELITYSGAGSPEDNLFTNSLLVSNSVVLDYWNRAYHHIYCANAIIEGVEASVSPSPEDKNRFKAEALFVRALVHFYLTNTFGDVPYIATTDYEANRRAVRQPAAQVYEKMIADLQLSIELFPADYSIPERTKPDKYATYALLARVYLYDGRWAEAADAATAVLDAPGFVLEENLDNVFLKESRSTIWQFKPKITGSNADEGATFIFMDTPPPSLSLQEELVGVFEAGDLRRVHWVKTLDDGTSQWHHAYKYKQNVNTGTSFEYSVVFRLEEMLLIRAEALARMGNLEGGLTDLNTIRNRAGLINAEASSSEVLVNAILQERRVEFFTEYGHRFFDLKRTQKANQILPLSKPGWNNTDILWPLPEAELLANSALAPQNPGY
jgi:tetratricopeptide (TPR) repeat protein